MNTLGLVLASIGGLLCISCVLALCIGAVLGGWSAAEDRAAHQRTAREWESFRAALSDPERTDKL